MEKLNNQQNIKIMVNERDITYIKEALSDIRKEMRAFPDVYVTQREFAPIKKVYDKLSLAGITVIVALGGVGLYLFNCIKNKFEQ